MNAPQTPTNPDPFLRRNEAAAFFGGLHVNTIDRWVKTGRLPPPIRLSPGVVGWRRSTLEEALRKAGGQA